MTEGLGSCGRRRPARAPALAVAWALASALALGFAAAPAVAFDTGQHTLRLVHGGLERHALVQVPASLDRSRPAPLLLAFHGGGGHAAFMADDERYGLVSLAERRGWIVVFPNGFSRLPGGRLATWNAGGCCGPARDRGVDDVGFSRALVAAVGERLNIDRSRVFATGMSNGGMMALRLACDAADLVRAVAAVAGTEASAGCAPSRAVSVLQIHARDDGHVQYAGGAGPDAVRNRASIMDYVSVPETVERWRTRLACRQEPEPWLARAGARCERYAGCRDGALLQSCVTDAGGHSWPGAGVVRRGKPAASQALDANEVMAAFFSDAAR